MTKSLRYKIASKLSHWAGRIHPDFDFRVMGWSFTFERGEGLVWHSGYFGHGTPVLYQQSQYEKAHTYSGKKCLCTDCMVRDAQTAETEALLRRRGATQGFPRVTPFERGQYVEFTHPDGTKRRAPIVLVNPFGMWVEVDCINPEDPDNFLRLPWDGLKLLG